jgi:hypothetical protein
MASMICILAKAEDIDEARRMGIRFFEENLPGHQERLEEMLPLPLHDAASGTRTHWLCFMRTVDDWKLRAIERYRDKYQPPMTVHILGPSPPIVPGQSLRSATDAARDAWLASQGLMLEHANAR